MKNEFNALERIIHRINNKILIPALSNWRRKKLNNIDFSIISNNCWGGVVYEYFGLKKNSPTVGLYFFAADYIKFIYNMRYYTSIDIEMIEAKQSKYAQKLKMRNQLNVPVGRLDDIDVIFLHYANPAIAKEKWKRRCERINWDNLIFKFSYMGGCTDEMVMAFEEFRANKKVMFVTKEYHCKDTIIIPPANGEEITNDTFYFNKYIDIYQLINGEASK